MKRFAHAIFCDDIRQELGGKFTFVGVYGANLLVPRFPTVLPKLCVVVNMATPSDQPFEALKFRVLKGDDTIAEGDFGNIAKAADELSNASHERVMRVVTHAIFSPFKVDASGLVRVQILTEDGEIEAGSLQIDQKPALDENGNKQVRT